MGKARRQPDALFTGRWRITSMSAWDGDYPDAEEPAYIEFGAKGGGAFHFGYVHGVMDCRPATRDGRPAVEWTWEGNDEMDPAQGRGWAVRAGDELRGMIVFHGGDESEFTATRADATGREGGRRRIRSGAGGAFAGTGRGGMGGRFMWVGDARDARSEDQGTRMAVIYWPILHVGTGTLDAFVTSWERFCTGYDEEFYRTNIGRPLTEARIARWYEWKNGTPLSAKKKRAILRFASAEERVADDADAETLEAFLSRPGGAVWRIFWLHLQHPTRFPIYDQHVHRAMSFLLKRPDAEPPASNPAKVRTYLGVYRPFFDRLRDRDPRQVDRALWSFGRFLKSGYGRLLTAPAG